MSIQAEKIFAQLLTRLWKSSAVLPDIYCDRKAQYSCGPVGQRSAQSIPSFYWPRSKPVKTTSNYLSTANLSIIGIQTVNGYNSELCFVRAQDSSNPKHEPTMANTTHAKKNSNLLQPIYTHCYTWQLLSPQAIYYHPSLFPLYNSPLSRHRLSLVWAQGSNCCPECVAPVLQEWWLVRQNVWLGKEWQWQ